MNFCAALHFEMHVGSKDICLINDWFTVKKLSVFPLAVCNCECLLKTDNASVAIVSASNKVQILEGEDLTQYLAKLETKNDDDDDADEEEAKEEGDEPQAMET